MTSSALETTKLRETLYGRVIAPGDAEYDEARTTFYGGYDRRPMAIIRPTNVNEVALVISLARDNGLDLAVRSGGHSVAGHCVSDGGLVLDLAGMQALDIDPDRRIARAQAGLTAGAVTNAAGAYGLAIGFGDTGSVGIGGITLGGGVGFLARKYGLTIDDLVAADIVSADGRLLHVDADNYPDLFWAIRGGGGNFGVVTEFTYRLHELPGVVGGMRILPATPDAIADFIAEAEAAPEELSTMANVMSAPPMPFVPPELHGKIVIMALMCYAGESDAGERAIAHFRALATPIVDMLKPMTYPEIYMPEEEGYHPIATSRTLYVDTFDRSSAEAVVDHLENSDAMMRVAQLRVLGAAVARVPDDATAYAHRSRPMMVNVAALCESTDEADQRTPWVTEFAASLNRGDDAGYVGFLGDEGTDRVRAAYPGSTWDRLAAVKATYDPDNLFRLNQNIAPASSTRDV